MSDAGALRRDPDAALVGGVCAGLGERLGIDPILVRVAVSLVVIATAGVGLIAYAIAWALIPGPEEPGLARASPPRREPKPHKPRRGNWRVAAGVGLLTLSLLLVLRELGIWWSDALIWPLVLAASGGALLWRLARNEVEAPLPDVAPEPPPSARLRPGVPAVARTSAGVGAALRGPRPPIGDLYRGGFGIALVLGAVLLFLSANDVLGETRDVVLTVIAASAGIALILAPFLWRLGRNLAAERTERIRSQERAELAAHLHDSVLQTLTLVQKRSGDSREVAQLARRQERELREWLFDAERAPASASLARALEHAAAEVEDAHGVPIEVVAVGDSPITERSEALTAAAREAMVNAAKFAPDSGGVAVFAELANEAATVFVRDRGPGFDPAAVPGDRRGISESIIGRMQRAGGRAEIRAAPGAGTEIELAITIEER